MFCAGEIIQSSDTLYRDSRKDQDDGSVHASKRKYASKMWKLAKYVWARDA